MALTNTNTVNFDLSCPHLTPAAQIVHVSIKAAFLNCGQNCAGGERFFIHRKVLDSFVNGVVTAVNKMRQGPPLGHGPMDAGAMTMAGELC